MTDGDIDMPIKTNIVLRTWRRNIGLLTD